MLSSFGSGSVPAIESLALCIAQAQALNAVGNSDSEGEGERKGEVDVGRLFGALAVLQAIGQTIAGVRFFLKNSVCRLEC